jgi:hypothetical protein
VGMKKQKMDPPSFKRKAPISVTGMIITVTGATNSNSERSGHGDFPSIGLRMAIYGEATTQGLLQRKNKDLDFGYENNSSSDSLNPLSVVSFGSPRSVFAISAVVKTSKACV